MSSGDWVSKGDDRIFDTGHVKGNIIFDSVTLLVNTRRHIGRRQPVVRVQFNRKTPLFPRFNMKRETTSTLN